MHLFPQTTVTVLVAGFMRDFSAQVEAGERSRRTAVAYEKAIRFFLMRFFAGRNPAEIATKEVAQAFATVSDEHGPALGNQGLQVCSMVFDWGVRNGLLAEGVNPARLVRRNPSRNRRVALTVDQSQAVTNLCCQAFLEPEGSRVLSPVLGAYFLVVLGLGIRRSEGTHLQLPEWDAIRREVTITRHKTVRKVGPKVLPANDFVAATLDEVVRRAWHPVWFFPSKRSRRGHIEDPGKAWARVRKTCGLPDGVRIHDLRHTFAAAVYAATKDLKAVQRLLGHSSVATSSHYVGALPARHHQDDSQRAVEFMLGGGRDA